MAISKEELKSLVISEEARSLLSPEELAELEQALRELREEDIQTVRLTNVDKFDAKDMRPADQTEPVRWKLKDSEQK